MSSLCTWCGGVRWCLYPQPAVSSMYMYTFMAERKQGQPRSELRRMSSLPQKRVGKDVLQDLEILRVEMYPAMFPRKSGEKKPPSAFTFRTRVIFRVDLQYIRQCSKVYQPFSPNECSWQAQQGWAGLGKSTVRSLGSDTCFDTNYWHSYHACHPGSVGHESELHCGSWLDDTIEACWKIQPRVHSWYMVFVVYDLWTGE
ncbi:hypothetical protein KCU90_g54, partial [Aureobasidium melanogenum]